MSPRTSAFVVCFFAAAPIPLAARAQPAGPAAAIVEEPLRDGDSSIVATLPGDASTSLVAVRIDGSDATPYVGALKGSPSISARRRAGRGRSAADSSAPCTARCPRSP